MRTGKPKPGGRRREPVKCPVGFISVYSVPQSFVRSVIKLHVYSAEQQCTQRVVEIRIKELICCLHLPSINIQLLGLDFIEKYYFRSQDRTLYRLSSVWQSSPFPVATHGPNCVNFNITRVHGK